MKGLNNAHAGPVCPIQSTGRSRLEVNLLLPKLDSLQACVGQHLDPRRHGSRKPEIVGSGHAVNDIAILVATRNRPDYFSVVRNRWAACQAICGRPVIETSIYASKLPRFCEALQCLVDGGSVGKISKVAGRPDGMKPFRYALE
jgi:hypothetical protein